jgi:excisionase family DNA binding protein
MASRTQRGQKSRWRAERGSFGSEDSGVIAAGTEAAARLLTIQEAADRLRISRWLVYNLIRANQLRTIRIGRRRLVTPEALAECIAMLEGDSSR